MAIHFTKDQEKVILQRNKNVLVSAAAGSGKTAVLTERIIQLVSRGEDKCDIDRLLVVTFTSAAASEMRERIRNALGKKMEEHSEDLHLQKQLTLIHNAQITTIDSFCLYIIRNNFNDIGLDPGFRVADEGEISLLKQEVAQELLEESFELQTPSFLYCVESLSKPGKEQAVMEYVMSLYQFAMSYPFPIQWLQNCKKTYLSSSFEAFEKSEMMQDLLLHVREKLKDCCSFLEEALLLCDEEGGPIQYSALLTQELEYLEAARELNDFTSLFRFFNLQEFGRLPGKKDPEVDLEKKEQVKRIRDFVKKICNALKADFFYLEPEQIYQDICDSYPAVAELIDLTCQFHDKFGAKKREKNLIDFSDMEHFALSILIEEKDGAFFPTKTALAYREYYKEIMTDEYQDSNLVQEFLLWSIAREEEGKQNRFMVGDVKQSIYKFRLARPEIFMDKYKTYPKEGNDNNVRIDLKQNFRSRHEVLSTVNYVFKQIMTESLGGIHYDDDAALYLGANYKNLTDIDDSMEQNTLHNKTEVILLETKNEIDTEEGMNDGAGMESDPSEAELDKKEAEALAIAGRIKELYGVFPVTDSKTGELRPARYQDMVILLRSNRGWDDLFKRMLEAEGIPCYISSKSGYFSAIEIQEVLNFLRIIDNPMQDIPMCSVLTARVWNFKEEELAKIRVIKMEQHLSFYERMQSLVAEETNLKQESLLLEKSKRFLENLQEYRKMAVFTPIHELIYRFYEKERFYYEKASLPGGEQRRANLDMLLEKAQSFEKTSYHGLFHFIRYMEQLEKYEVDYGEANIADETANVVRIMSIHKSKGLEFPICFLAGLSKQFNQQDMRKPMVYDLEYGIGADYLNPIQRFQVPTIRKRMIANKMKMELLGEELRILYVAMTRAKEKLILTGTISTLEKVMQSGSLYSGLEQESLPFSSLLSMRSYLEFILAAIFRHGKPDASLFEVSVVSIEDFVQSKAQETLQSSERKDTLLSDETPVIESLFAKLKEDFSYAYPYSHLAEMITKTTVSELKKMDKSRQSLEGEGSLEDDGFFTFEEPEIIPYLPKFIGQEEYVGGAERGTAYHRALELLDFGTILEAASVQKQIDLLCKNGRLDQKSVELIEIKKLTDFFATKLGQRMCLASRSGTLKKEQPFMLGVAANRVKEEYPEEELVLVQGIIDAYFEEGDELVLVDYKTDRVDCVEELAQRYQLQVGYYAEALERLVGKRVKERLIYSIRLGEVVEVP